MKVLVTGGAGFVGSHLVDRLLAEGCSVDVVDDLSGGSLANLADARAGAEGRLSFQRLDVAGTELAALLDRRRPEVVFHLARPGGGAGDQATRSGLRLSTALHLLSAADLCGVTKVVVALRAAELYAEATAKQLPLREAHPLEPRTPEGIADRAVLDALRLWRERRDLEHTALALGEVYGPRQSVTAGVVAALACAAAHGQALEPTGDGGDTDDYIYVDDAVDALARSASRGSGLLLNVGTGEETSLAALAAVVAAAAPAPGPGAPVAGDPSAGGTSRPARCRRRLALDPSRAGLHLGWEPWTTLEEGVAATVEWWAAHPR